MQACTPLSLLRQGTLARLSPLKPPYCHSEERDPISSSVAFSSNLARNVNVAAAEIRISKCNKREDGARRIKFASGSRVTGDIVDLFPSLLELFVFTL